VAQETIWPDTVPQDSRPDRGVDGKGAADERIAVDVAAPSTRRDDRRMAVEISGVTRCPSDDDLIIGANLENPRTGPVEGYAVKVSGWVIGKAPVAEVQFVHEQSVVACCELDVTRPDVAAARGGSSQVGFSKAIETVGLAPEFTIEVRVAFQDGRQDVIAKIYGTQQLTSGTLSFVDQYELISKSSFFSADFYLCKYQDVADQGVDPVVHYLERGAAEGRDPHEQFDTAHYLEQCAMRGLKVENPLLHFLIEGRELGISPKRDMPRQDEQWVEKRDRRLG
jgi:hypothetical protein